MGHVRLELDPSSSQSPDFICEVMTMTKKLSALCLLVILTVVWSEDQGRSQADEPATKAPPKSPSKEEIAQAIKQLGDDNFTVRQKASEVLRAAGRAAEAALEAGAKSKDAEVSRRSREILDDFKWGIYPDTPPKVLDQILRYRGGDDEAKQKAYQALVKLGGPGFDALVKIAGREENAQLKRDIYDEMTRAISLASGDLIVEGKLDTLEQFLELSLASGSDIAYRNYAALQLFRRQLDDKIVQFKARADKKDAKAAEALCFLYRAKGDLAGARWAADKSSPSNPRLPLAIRLEAGDWQELAKRYDKIDDPDEYGLGKISLALGYHRQAGNTAEVDKAIAQIKKFTEEHLDDPGTTWLGAKALYLNGRPDEALALLLRGKNYQPAFDILAFQSRYAEALDLLKKATDLKAEEALLLKMSEARVRNSLGQNDQVTNLLAKLADEVEQRDQSPTPHDLLRLQLRLGLKKEAFDYAAGLLAKELEKTNRDQILGVVFPDHAAAAPVWWTVLRKEFNADQSTLILKRINQLFGRQITGKELDTLLAQAEKSAEEFKANPWIFWQALADVAAAAGKKDLQQKYLQKAIEEAPDSAPLLRLADLLAEQKQWPEAAKRYRQAWEMDKTQPLALFLQGRVLSQSGQEAEGRKLMETAHWLPLGNEYIRYHFAKALAERGLEEDAQRERDLILRVGALDGWAVNETLRTQGYVAQSKKDYRTAGDLFEQFRLRCLRTSVSFVEYSANVQVPALVHQNRARAFVVDKKFAEAKKEWELCLQLVPGNVNLPIYLVAELEKAGNKQDANDVFNQVFTLQQKLCADFPKSSTSHNTLAWLGAVCRRQLPLAEEHANKAVALAPDYAGYIDTLAEVHFQQGRQAKAIELMKGCIALEPKNDYFKKQLKRFEAGDPKADVPDEGQ
jgi:tetratricopeptide (TPR) repeat protein